MTHYLSFAWGFANVSIKLNFIPGPGPPSKTRHLGTPSGVPGTAGLQSHLSPPESIHELTNNPPSLYNLSLSTNWVLWFCPEGGKEGIVMRN